MKKFLIPLFAGLFVVSLLLAPVAVLADTTTPVDPAMTCRVRSDVGQSELAALANTLGVDNLDPTPGVDMGIEAGRILPYDTAGFSDPPLLLQKRKLDINKNFGIICVYSLIEWITNIAFLIIAALSVLMIIFAAFLYITAGASPEGTKKAKNFLLYAVIGIVIAILARIIPNIIIAIGR